jgi:hypothetical protein
MFVSHLWALNLPYFWDEAGQYIPTALDLLHGSWISHSAPPLLHPPGVPAYLAMAWKVAGFHPAVTRSAMLLLAAGALLMAFLLSIELSRDVRGTPAFLVAALVCACPVFFAQAVMAELDGAAMLFTLLALLLFLKERMVWAAAACAVLVLVKETGAVIPVVLLLWLLHEGRRREAGLFLASLAPLGIWAIVLRHATGHVMGTAGFLEYNLLQPLHPTHFVISLGQRLYYLLFANFHWMGTQAILLAWRTTRVFRSRSWQIAILVTAAHVLTVTLSGGAVLERYLLPVMPIVYSAMVAGLMLLRTGPRLVCSGVLLAGVVAGNWINPFYPFPYEDNIAFSDFVKLHAETAEFLAQRFPEARIATAWPMTAEILHPELGYVRQPLHIERLPDFTPATIQAVDWKRVDVLVVYSRRWDPRINVLHWGPLERLWSHFARSVPDVNSAQGWGMVPYPNYAHFERRGQWVDVYAKPGAGNRMVVEERCCIHAGSENATTRRRGDAEQCRREGWPVVYVFSPRLRVSASSRVLEATTLFLHRR